MLGLLLETVGPVTVAATSLIAGARHVYRKHTVHPNTYDQTYSTDSMEGPYREGWTEWAKNPDHPGIWESHKLAEGEADPAVIRRLEKETYTDGSGLIDPILYPESAAMQQAELEEWNAAVNAQLAAEEKEYQKKKEARRALALGYDSEYRYQQRQIMNQYGIPGSVSGTTMRDLAAGNQWVFDDGTWVRSVPGELIMPEPDAGSHPGLRLVEGGLSEEKEEDYG